MSKIYIKNNFEGILEKIYLYISKKKTIYHISLGYLSSVLISFINGLSHNSLNEMLISTFGIKNRYENLITYMAVLLVFGYIILENILKKYFKNKTIDKRLGEIYAENTNKIFAGHETEGIGWGLGKTVLSCPEITKGWDTDDIEFVVNNNLYDFSTLKKYDKTLKDRDLNQEYDYYRNNEFKENFTTDSDRLMLVKRPVSSTDDYKITVKLKKVKWSQLQFFWNKIIDNNERKKKYIDDFYETNVIHHPNSFCLHLIIITSDNKILITENSSNKSNDYAKTWAVSIGEQIDNNDVNNHKDCALAWVDRALKEELSITNEDYNKSEIDFISVNLEGDIVNFALVCTVNLSIDSEDIKNKINSEIRMDNEFKHIDFLDFDDIPKEIINNGRVYHPSSSIRMLYAYLHKKGAADFKINLLNNIYKSGKVQ